MDESPVNNQLIFNRYFKINPLTIVSSENSQKGAGFLKKLRHYALQQHLEDLRQFSQLCVIKLVLTEGEKIAIFYQTNA